MKWDERFEVHEDESGKWPWPVWFVTDTRSCDVVAGPFDMEDEAIDVAGELACSQI